MAERIDYQISDIPCADSENIHADPMIGNCQRAKKTDVEYKLFGEGERNRRQPTIQMALVVFFVNPVQRSQMEGAVRGIVPNLRPNCSSNEGKDERKPTCSSEKATIDQDRQQHRMNRGVQRVPQLSSDLISSDRQIVNDSFADRPFPGHCQVPEQSHQVPKGGDDQE